VRVCEERLSIKDLVVRLHEVLYKRYFHTPYKYIRTRCSSNDNETFGNFL
jgi:hypothetical protein